MKTLKKISCLLLALLMLVACVACSKDGDGVVTDANGNVVSTGGEDTYAIDFSGKNYDGYEFRVLRADIETGHNWSGSPNDIDIAESSQDILANAVYKRNDTLKQMLNVDISMDIISMDGGGKTPFQTKLTTSVTSGEGGYDLVVVHMRGSQALINNGLFGDMNNLALDTSYSWWDNEAKNALNINGKQFAMISDITFVDKLSTVGVFYNTDMAAELGIENIYSVVDEGNWTFEKMKELAKTATGSGDDIYGVSSQNDFSYYVLQAANIPTVVKDSQGGLSFNLASNRAMTVLQDVFTVMNDNYFFNRQMDGSLNPDEVAQQFGDHNLFLVRPLQAFYDMKNYYDNYGILPIYDLTIGTYSEAWNDSTAHTDVESKGLKCNFWISANNYPVTIGHNVSMAFSHAGTTYGNQSVANICGGSQSGKHSGALSDTTNPTVNIYSGDWYMVIAASWNEDITHNAEQTATVNIYGGTIDLLHLKRSANSKAECAYVANYYGGTITEASAFAGTKATFAFNIYGTAKAYAGVTFAEQLADGGTGVITDNLVGLGKAFFEEAACTIEKVVYDFGDGDDSGAQNDPTTNTPTDNNTTPAETTTAAATTAAPAAEEGGCGSMIGASAIVIVAVMGTAVAVGKKKED